MTSLTVFDNDNDCISGTKCPQNNRSACRVHVGQAQNWQPRNNGNHIGTVEAEKMTSEQRSLNGFAQASGYFRSLDKD